MTTPAKPSRIRRIARTLAAPQVVVNLTGLGGLGLMTTSIGLGWSWPLAGAVAGAILLGLGIWGATR